MINIDKDGCHFVKNNTDLSKSHQFSGSTLDIHNRDAPDYLRGNLSHLNDLVDDDDKQCKENSLINIANLSIYSDRSDAVERKTIDQIEPESRTLNVQNSNKQMSN